MFNKRVLILLLCLFPLSSSAAVPYPTAEEKMQVRLIVTRVARLSREAPTLDALCQSTMAQGAQMLAIGPRAVYELSCLLDHPDWKVRFWIVDMLGYLENPDGARPLERVIRDESELQVIRDRARLSLGRLARKKETAGGKPAVDMKEK